MHVSQIQVSTYVDACMYMCVHPGNTVQFQTPQTPLNGNSPDDYSASNEVGGVRFVQLYAIDKGGCPFDEVVLFVHSHAHTNAYARGIFLFTSNICPLYVYRTANT